MKTMKTSRQASLALLLGASASLAPAGAGEPVRAAGAQKPNIVFIFSDDHSLQTIGAYGTRLAEFCKEHAITPNIDRLAAEGGLFPNSFCGNSLCSPSRATVLTGLHSHANGVMNIRDQPPISPGIWTFPQGLRAAGYQNYLVGKWHLDRTTPTFDDWLVLPEQGEYFDPDFKNPAGETVKTGGHVSDVITGFALEWLKKRDPSKPFFLAIHHKAPHRPWEPPPRYAAWLDDVRIPEPDTLFDDYSTRGSAAREQKMNISKDMSLDKDLKVNPEDAKNPAYAARNAEFRKLQPKGPALTQWKYQHYMKDYLRCVKSVDDSVGRIMEELKEAGIAGDTIVIYSADQGFYNGEHGWFDKRWIYDESLHMPFIVRWPGVVKPGTRFTEFIQNIDYAPTFLDMAGGKAPEGLHGHSLVPILRGETPDGWRKSVYYHYYGEHTAAHHVAAHYGVRTDRHTLAYFHGKNEWELYDNDEDPAQVRNVHADPACAKTVVELKAGLVRLRALYQDSDDIAPAPVK
jgi:arylsulfatase A-like enzyme